MNESKLETIEQIQEFLTGTADVTFSVPADESRLLAQYRDTRSLEPLVRASRTSFARQYGPGDVVLPAETDKPARYALASCDQGGVDAGL